MFLNSFLLGLILLAVACTAPPGTLNQQHDASPIDASNEVMVDATVDAMRQADFSVDMGRSLADLSIVQEDFAANASRVVTATITLKATQTTV